MFQDSVGCKIIGCGHTSKHDRYWFSLLSPDYPEFRTEFTNVIAYSDNRDLFGKHIINVEKVTPITVLDGSWVQIERAVIGGIWPKPWPKDETQAAQQAANLGLNGYRITVEGDMSGWVISSDYLLLGRRKKI